MLSYNTGYLEDKSPVKPEARQGILGHRSLIPMSTSNRTPDPNEYKRCPSCNRMLALFCFTKHIARPDGLSRTCRECQREKRKGRAEYQANYRSTHRRERQAYLADYVPLNRSRISKQQSRWYYGHQDAVRERVTEHHKANPDIARASRRRRKDRDNNIANAFSSEDWRYCLKYWRGVCAYCGNPPSLFDRDLVLHMDHYVPVSDTKNCPGTIPTNILPACQTCNYSKKAHSPRKWMAVKFGKQKAEKIEKRIQVYFDSLEKDLK